MQTQTQCPNFGCVCVCVTACICECVCVCMLSAMMSLLPESASPSAEMKELNSNSKPNETKTEEKNGEKRRRRGCMRARNKEEMKRNCRGTNAWTKKPSHIGEICFYRLIFLLWAAENVKNNNNRNNQCGGERVDLSLTLQRCSLQLFSVHTEDLQLSSISTTTQQPNTWHHPPALWLASRDAGLRLVQQGRGGEGEEEEVVLGYFRGNLLTSNWKLFIRIRRTNFVTKINVLKMKNQLKSTFLGFHVCSTNKGFMEAAAQPERPSLDNNTEKIQAVLKR